MGMGMMPQQLGGLLQEEMNQNDPQAEDKKQRKGDKNENGNDEENKAVEENDQNMN